jgi:catechol 2,3-dioxygenase-like lactoylglutathione lyase family enzyme
MAGVRGLDHVNLRVPADLLEPVRSFYIDLVGLQEGFRPPMGSGSHGYWLYAGESAVLHLSTGGAENSIHRGTGYFSHVAFACTDLEATSARLEAAAVPHRTVVLDEGAQVQIFVVDPAGVTVELNFRR